MKERWTRTIGREVRTRRPDKGTGGVKRKKKVGGVKKTEVGWGNKLAEGKK